MVPFKIFTKDDIVKLLPKRMKKANEVLFLNTDDDVMSVLRYFDWNQEKMESNWYNEEK